MLPRRPACCRALHRPNQALPSAESIWISDALLLSTFQRFLVNSQSTRRHGSFVPGPLESRRRMGKRRMAYIADAGTPMFGSGGPWAWMGDIKSLSWRWQAPTSPMTRATKTEIIPRWLALWPYPPDIPISTELESAAGWLPEDATFGREKLLAFQQDLCQEDANKLAICAKFNQHMKQSIKLGVVDEDILRESLSFVTDQIHIVFVDAALAATRKMAFYQAVWGGIISCKVLPIDTFRATTMDHLLDHISALPVSLKMRELARDVLNTVSKSQLAGMNRSIQSLINTWSLSWLVVDNKLFNIRSCDGLMLNAKAAVEASYLALLGSQSQLTKTWKEEGKVDLKNAQQVIDELKEKISFAIKTIKKCEALLFPVRRSINELAHTLQKVTPSALNSIIETCTHNIIQRYGHRIMASDDTNIRISLLSLVSHLPNASRDLFVQTWRALDTQHLKWRVAEDIGSDFILSHMISQGFIKDPAWMRNNFEASPDSPTLKAYGDLLISLYKQDNDWSGPLYLLHLLVALDKHHSVYKAIETIAHRRLNLPVESIRSLLTSVAHTNPRIAFSMYNLCVPYMHSKKNVDVSLCPDFVISMIHDAQIEPQSIWKALGIPIYENLRRGNRYHRVHKSSHELSPTWIALITKMATAFSISEARPQRVAFRNVSQCLLHLRRYGVPISPELTRALSYSGITREIMRENWISKERLHWILSIVEAGEGKSVSDKIEATVELWWRKMEQLSINTRHLRLGPVTSTGSATKEKAMASEVQQALEDPTLQNRGEKRTRVQVESNKAAKMATYTPLNPTS